MTFEEYLTKRRINVAAFAAGDPIRFAQWQNWFGQMHPESFTLEVKMVLNDIRKKFWLAEVPKPVVAETEAATTAPRPAGRRAAIAKPAVPTETVKPEIQPEETTKPSVELSPEKTAEPIPASEVQETETAAKLARPIFRPRAVIKKPASETPAEATPDTEKSIASEPAENKTEEPKPSAENPETAAPKPARPRAVIKRPAALSSPENKPAAPPENLTPEKPEITAKNPSQTVADPGEKVNPENAAEKPKPRARPVFKRPASTEIVSGNKAVEPEKTVADTPQNQETNLTSETATENPVAKPGQEGASEVKAITEEIQASPEGAKAAEEIAAAAGHMPKPPRPRPVFKRPAAASISSKNKATEPEKTVSETVEKSEPKTEEIQPEKPSEMLGNPDEKEEDSAPKPPRPRPVFKRPAKPEGDYENPQQS